MLYLYKLIIYVIILVEVKNERAYCGNKVDTKPIRLRIRLRNKIMNLKEEFSMEKKNNRFLIVIVLLVIIIVLLVGLIVFFADEIKEEREDREEFYSYENYNNTDNEASIYSSSITVNNNTNDNVVNNNNNSIVTNDNNYKSKDEALKIALSDAQINQNDIYDVSVELDYKYNQEVYEVDFKYQQFEYEYYINAGNGNIVKSFKEIN